MKNVKTIKGIIFASVLLVMVIGLTSVDMADAKIDSHNGKVLIKDTKSDNDIPYKQEKLALSKQYKETISENTKSEILKDREILVDNIRQWYKENANPAKETVAREKQEILTNALSAEKDIIGFEVMEKIIPWTTIGYDYVDNALEITIVPSAFTSDNITRYVEKIRNIVGDEVDITLSPQDYPVPETCTSRTSGECDPIKGGVEFEVGGFLCTTGFKATYNSDTGFVTAGHCVDGLAGGSGDDVEQSNGESDVGDVEKEMWYNNSACDCAFISELSSSRSMDDGIFGLTDPNTTSNPFVGMTVKLSGKNSGVEEGEVSDTSENINYSGITIKYLVVADYDSISGDSGGPIVSGSALVGIHSGSDTSGIDAYFTKHSKFTTYFSGLSWGF